MTTAQAVGAVSREAAEWYAINWQAIHRNVRRLQVRIVQATKASRWGRVRALQRLLTHSYSGKVLAVRRVTENNGKKTPGVDQEIWNTPEKKTQAVHALKRRGYRSQPLRRVYIPKSDGKTMRPLGMRRCDGTVLQSTEKRQHAVDSGGRHQVLFRQDFTRLAFGSRPDGPSHSPKVVEIRVHGKTRPSRINGWDSPRRNHLSRARQLRAGRTGTAPAGKIPRR